MSLWSKVWNGTTDVFDATTEVFGGVGGFLVDTLKGARTAADGDFSEAAEILVGSVQEDLLGGVIGGLMGPEGIGGTLIGALPEEIRDPGRVILDPVFGAWDWTIQEVVDRPLGTVATIYGAALNGGPEHFFDLDTYTRAWKINDERTAGQSFAAALWMIDPFDEEEYNSIQDDPIFNLISGTADFVQEFIDPVTYVGGTSLKLLRGTTVTAKAGRTFASGRNILNPKGSLVPKRVLGKGTGLRPGTIGGKRRGIFTKTDAQREVVKGVQQNYLSQRVANVIDSPKWRAGNDLIDQSQAGKAVPLLPKERFAILRDHLGATGRSLSDEALILISNGDNAAKRNNNLRALSGDFSVFREMETAAAALRNVLSEAKYPGGTGVASFVAKSGDVDAIAALNDFDWAMLDVFGDELERSQRVRYDYSIGNGRYEQSGLYQRTLGELSVEKTLLALDQLLSDEVGGPRGLAAAAPNVISEMPTGTRLQEFVQKQRAEAERNGSSVTQIVNHNTVGGRNKVVRWLTERVPQTHIFFLADNAVEQFRRTLVQAMRVDGIERAPRWVEEQVGHFAGLHVAKDAAEMQRFFSATMGELISEVDEMFDGKIDGYARDIGKLSDTMAELNDEWTNAIAPDKIVGVTNEAGVVDATLRVVREGDTKNTLIVQYGFSPAQVEASALLPRFDVVQRTAELADKGKLNQKVREIGRGTSDLVQPVYQFWRQSVLLTPKWPMRVALDEQLRIASQLGAVSTISNFAKGFEDLRRAQSVFNLQNWDEVGKVERLNVHMAGRLGFLDDSDLYVVDLELKRQLKDPETGEAIRVADLPPEVAARRKELIDQKKKHRAASEILENNDLVELWDQVGQEGFDEAVKSVIKELVTDARNRNRLVRNAGVKGLLAGAVIGNPVIGAMYGMASFTSRRRRVRDASTQKSALNYAGAMRQQGRMLMADAFSPEDLVAAKAMLSDAAFIEEQVVKAQGKTALAAERAQSAFDKADELMEQAGVPSLQIGSTNFRNAFGDDPRFQEQIRSENSANKSQGAIFTGAKRFSEDQISKFSPKERIVGDYLSGVSSSSWNEAYENMINLYTSSSIKNEFYQIVWGDGIFQNRVDELADLLVRDHELRERILKNTGYFDKSPGLDGKSVIGYESLQPEDFKNIAKGIMEEYENILPSDFFPKTRAKARSGTFTWADVQREMMSLETSSGQRLAIIRGDFVAGTGYDVRKNGIEAANIEAIRNISPQPGRASYESFGRAHAPERITTSEDISLIERGKEKARGLFTILGELPSDNLARHPFFNSVYEREMRRQVEHLVDADGNLNISQNAIDKIEDNARQVALKEVRTLLYDLAETTRAGEYLANISPFFNAWQEVVGRWSGIAVENPFFVGEAMRIYRKPWEAETLGLSEVTTDDGSTYFVFRLFGDAYDETGAESTIFDAIPESVRSWAIPKALRDSDAPLRFSKNGLNTMLQGSPGVGPMVTIPIREAIMASPQLEESVSFLFPFGHPKAGFLGRVIHANAPTWAKSVDNMVQDTHTAEALQARTFRDIMVQMAAAGTPFDYSDELMWNEVQELAESRTRDLLFFQTGASLLFPTSVSPMSPYQPLIEEYRELEAEHGFRVAQSMFLDLYGEDFFALSARMSQLNDGVSSSIEAETIYMQLDELIQAHPAIGGFISRSLGSTDGNYAYSSIASARQFQTELAPGSDKNRRELKSGREVMEFADTQLGWKAYSELMDWVRIQQDLALAAGLNPHLNTNHMRGVAAVKAKNIAKIAEKHPIWETEYLDIFASERKRKEINDGFVAALADKTILGRADTKHVIEYFELRMFVQRELIRRKEEDGGSLNLERAKSNANLFGFWEQEKEKLGRRPEFSSVYDRYFERDNISMNTFIDDDAFAQGLFL